MDYFSLLNDSDTEDAAWTFNDINLTMVMIIMFFAMTFVIMISKSDGLSKDSAAQVVSETDTKKPTELSSYEYYGERGFPSHAQEKGLPVKDRFNDDLVISEERTIREGVWGNLRWDFEALDNLREKKYLRIYVDSEGVLTHDGEKVSVSDMQKAVQEESQFHNVFVELHVAEDLPIKKYDQLRNYLWNSTDAIHWKFITE